VIRFIGGSLGSGAKRCGVRAVGPAWQVATVEHVRAETASAKTLTVRPARPFAFRPGQHVEVRPHVRAPAVDGAPFSIASAPELDGVFEITVQLPGTSGVARYLHAEGTGGVIDVRGPFGADFTWHRAMGGPILLVAGGSGVAPLMSMLRHRRLTAATMRATLVYSAASMADVLFHDELTTMAQGDPAFAFICTLTRAQPEHWDGLVGRVDAVLLRRALRRMGAVKYAYVCGPREFAASIARHLADLGVPAGAVRVAGDSGPGREVSLRT